MPIKTTSIEQRISNLEERIQQLVDERGRPTLVLFRGKQVVLEVAAFCNGTEQERATLRTCIHAMAAASLRGERDHAAEEQFTTKLELLKKKVLDKLRKEQPLKESCT